MAGEQNPNTPPSEESKQTDTVSGILDFMGLSGAKSAVSNFITGLQDGASALGSFKDTLSSIGTISSQLVGGLASVGDASSSKLGAATDSMKKAAESINWVKEAANIAADAVETHFIGSFAGLGKESASNLNSISNQMGNITGVAGRFGLSLGKVGEGIKSVAQSADTFEATRSQILAAAAAGGKLRDTLGDMSNVDMSKLNDNIARTTLDMIRSAHLIGVSTQQYFSAYKNLQENTPNYFKNESIDIRGRKMDEVQAALALSEGTGRSYDKIALDIASIGKIYNASSKDSLEYIAKMSMVSDQFKIGSDTVVSILSKNREAFAYQITDGTDNSIQTLNRLMKGFQDTGLSAKQSAELIGEMTSNIGKMDVATKSFLSSQTGGPGGIRGALEIEGLISEGKTEEVMQKVEENMRKHFGGKIFSLKEARESEYAASQFMMQREMLKSGAFGISVQDDAKASRILEGLANQSGAGQADLGKAFQEYAGAGKTVLESNVTGLSLANAALEMEQFTLALKNATTKLNHITYDKENLKKITDDVDKIKEKNKNPAKLEDPRKMTSSLLGSMQKVGGRQAGFGRAAQGLVERDAGMVLKGLSSAITGTPMESPKPKEDQSNQNNAPTPKPKPQPTTKKTNTPTLSEEEANLDRALEISERSTKSNEQRQKPNLPRNQPQPTNRPTALPQTAYNLYNTPQPSLDARTQSNIGANQGQMAMSGGNMVVPTVEMHVDMTCETCNGKVKKVTVIRTKQDEVGGLTSVPTQMA